MITVKSFDGGQFDAYVALPAAGYGPGIVVLQEIFGVNEYLRNVCDWYAAHGFVAVCPDLFWRQEPGVQLTDQTEAEWQHAFQLYQGLDEARQWPILRQLWYFCGSTQPARAKWVVSVFVWVASWRTCWQPAMTRTAPW